MAQVSCFASLTFIILSKVKLLHFVFFANISSMERDRGNITIGIKL